MSQPITYPFLVHSLVVLVSSPFSVRVEAEEDGGEIAITDLTRFKQIVAPSTSIRSYEGMQHATFTMCTTNNNETSKSLK